MSEMLRRVLAKNEGELRDEWRVWDTDGKESVVWVQVGAAPFTRNDLTGEKSPPVRMRYVGRRVIRGGDLVRVK
jgi:hypothetical protein